MNSHFGSIASTLATAALAAAVTLAPCAARAGFTTVDTLGPGDEGKTLKNNTVYKVTANATISRIGTTSSALYVEAMTVTLRLTTILRR